MKMPSLIDRRAGVALLIALFSWSGCQMDSAVTPVSAAPEIVYSAVAANPYNVLSAIVNVRARNADSVAVHFGTASEGLVNRTPSMALTADSVTVPVLGLRAGTAYQLQVIARRGTQVSSGPVIDFVTGALPADLPRYVTSGTGANPGFVIFAAEPYAIAIDNTGTVLWYRRFSRGPGLNFQAHQSGRYLTRPPSLTPNVPAKWVELDVLGAETRTLGCAGELEARFHDLILEPDGSYWIMCDQVRTMDLTMHGGRPDARVTGTVVQHINRAGALLFQWSPFDHFDITDLPPADRSGATVNWTHGNALTLDEQGNLLVSFRSLDEITKIDTRTSQIIWRMGGPRNEFTFLSSMRPTFARQHGLRSVGENELLMLDNAGDPTESRAERYSYHEGTRTVREVASYGSGPPVIAALGGTVQQLADGHILVSFGNGGRVEEYDRSGHVVWRIEQPGYVFRAQRIQSLYQPGVGLGR